MGLRKDYHGSRSYSADPPADEGHPPSTLMGRLKSIFRPKSWPLRGPDGRTFSLLGDDEPHRRQSGRPLFPMAEWAAGPNHPSGTRRPVPTISSAGNAERPDQ